FVHCEGLKISAQVSRARMRPATVRSANIRRKALSLEKAFRWGSRNNRFGNPPTDSIRSDTALKEKPEGAIIRESEVASEPGAIDQWLKTIGLPVERVGMEAGGLSSWLCHELLASGWPMICIETRHAKAAMKAQQVKTDRNDARGLAHIMRTGWYREVHVKSRDSQELRMLLNNRRFLLDKRIAVDNEVRGSLRTFGLKLGKVTPAT